MGDIKRFRKKYIPPAHPWSKLAIESERELLKAYGLHRKKEIHKQSSFLKKYKDIAKRLIANTSSQGKKEREQMIKKLSRLGLTPTAAGLDDILSLQLNHILDRRLESVVVRKGLARSMRQARQFITHGHLQIGAKSTTSPSYLVALEEEAQIHFTPHSPLIADDHPERVLLPPKAPRKVPPKENRRYDNNRKDNKNKRRQEKRS